MTIRETAISFSRMKGYVKRSYGASESLINSLPTSPATLATPQSAAVIAGCDRAWQDEEMRSLIHSLPTFPATLATSQSAAVIAAKGDRTLEDEEKRSPFLDFRYTNCCCCLTPRSFSPFGASARFSLSLGFLRAQGRFIFSVASGDATANHDRVCGGSRVGAFD